MDINGRFWWSETMPTPRSMCSCAFTETCFRVSGSGSGGCGLISAKVLINCFWVTQITTRLGDFLAGFGFKVGRLRSYPRNSINYLLAGNEHYYTIRCGTGRSLRAATISRFGFGGWGLEVAVWKPGFTRGWRLGFAEVWRSGFEGWG